MVRRATEVDRDAVLGFASTTWDGWDYIPNAWAAWLEAPDGAFLVATVGQPTVGGPDPLDAEGNLLRVGQPIAITRVTMASASEAWLEGIRVDPNVRGMGVAADLQIAELNWVAAQGADVVRYATSAQNEGSHRLGARDDIRFLVAFRAWWWSATGSPEDEEEPSAYDAVVRAAATSRRGQLLSRAADVGLVAQSDSDAATADLWRRLSADPTFVAGHRLYEARPWAMQELTEPLFGRHIERTEVLVSRGGNGGDGWALAIVLREQLPGEDSSMRLAVLAGDASAAAGLADQLRRLAGESIRFRVPEGAPLIDGHEELFRRVGFVTPDWELHILARPMDSDHPIPEPDPTRVILADPPQPTLVPPRW